MSHTACLLGLAVLMTCTHAALAQTAATGATGGSAATTGTAAAAAASGAAAAPVAAPVTAILADLAVPATTTTAATAYSDPLQTGLAQYEALFCLPASFTPAAPVPANYTGKGFSITFSSGSCTETPAACPAEVPAPAPAPAPQPAASDPAASPSAGGAASAAAAGSGADAPAAAPCAAGPAVLSCIQPSLVVQQTPALYASASNGADAFTGAFCKVSGTIGSPSFEVLYTFNESTPLDTTTLASTLYGQVDGIIGSSSTGYSSEFMQVLNALSSAELAVLSAAQGIQALFSPTPTSAPAPAASAGAAAAGSTTAAGGR